MMQSKSIDELKDVRYVSVEQNLPKPEKINDYVTQMGDPYNFKWKHISVTVDFTPSGPTIEECCMGLALPC